MTVHSTLKLLIARENVRRVTARRSPLTLRELAEATNLALSTVTGLTSGRAKRIDFETIDKLCTYFNVQPGELLAWEAD